MENSCLLTHLDELFYIFENLQCEWRYVITSGLSVSDFSFFLHYLSHHSNFWKHCIFADILSIQIQCHIVTFVQASSLQIHSLSYTCKTRKISV
jgi:hypothetical protein